MRFLALAGLYGSILGLGSDAQAQELFAKGRVVVGFEHGVSGSEAQGVVKRMNGKVVRSIEQLGILVVELPAGANEHASARAFGQQRGVRYAEPDWMEAPGALPNDPSVGSQYHLGKVQAPKAWDSFLGTGVTVAILDTGCDPTHPDLVPKYVPGWNTYDNNADFADVYGHGTPVAGSAAAATNNGIGVAGVAWNAKIMPIRISDPEGYGYSSTVSAGLRWAADRGARVANVSYAMTYSSSVADAARYFMSKGGVVTMSAGNSSAYSSTPDSPFILTVGATDSSDRIATFSTYGPAVDLSAPGVGIYTTAKGGGYRSASGTSFSAPVTAGVAALVISANPSLSGQQVYDIMKASADDLGSTGWDQYFGTGRANAFRGITMAVNSGGTGGGTGGDVEPPTVAFSNPSDGSTLNGSVLVRVQAQDNVGVSMVSLYLDGQLVASDNAAPYEFPWDTTKVSNGIRRLKAVAQDAAGNSSAQEILVSVDNLIDNSAPSVALTSPSSTTVGQNFTVTGEASDNVGVVKVELWINNKLHSSTSSGPYSFSVNARKYKSGTSLNLQLRGYDAAGNVGRSQIVSVTVSR